jgi:ferredoxin
MTVMVDDDLCQGHGECELAAPEVFSLDDDGTLHVVEQPPEANREAVQRAERSCPVQAIRVVSA